MELQQQAPRKVELPEGQRDPGDPASMTPDQLYHAGEWLDRFVRGGEAAAYYQEALKRDANDSAYEREGDSFGKELIIDVFSHRADGLAQPYLAHALGYRREHHIHNPDAADDERDARDSGEQIG